MDKADRAGQDRQAAAQLGAVLRAFQGRRARSCFACGRIILARDEFVRLSDRVYHRNCSPADRAA
jgi:hypothetical protein